MNERKALSRNLKAPSARPHYRPHGRRGRKHRPQSPFLRLPAELRNEIYRYCIPNGRVLIQMNHRNKEYEHLKSLWMNENQIVHRPPVRLSHLLDNNDIDERLEITCALLLVSKKIHQEIKVVLYNQLTICFDSTKVVRAFMKRVGEDNLKAIKKLELHHTGYGQPKLTKNERFKDIHDRNWRKLCMTVGEKMTALESLKLDVEIKDLPLTLRSQDRWFRSLVKLAPRKLNSVEVRLSHKMIGQDRLGRAAKRVENAMMSDKGIKARDKRDASNAIQLHKQLEATFKAARIERLKSLPPVQAMKSLTITLPKQSTDVKAQNGTKEEKKYYTSKKIGYRGFVYGVPWDPYA